MADISLIQNPGSALGEAIGAQMEIALNNLLNELSTDLGCHYLSKGPLKKNKYTKLYMYDRVNTKYNIDAVITDESFHPLILIESKYIRYKKHNRDKGSWLCTAHPAIRRRYTSIRSSIAVLAGQWSSTSLAMIKSYDINVFLIPFAYICELLQAHDIHFNWDEKDRAAAMEAWRQYNLLTEEQRYHIGVEMINLIRKDLEERVTSILDDTTEREIKKVDVEIHTNLGEVRTFDFSSIPLAINFLNEFEFQQMFIVSDSITLFDTPAIEFDDEM